MTHAYLHRIAWAAAVLVLAAPALGAEKAKTKVKEGSFGVKSKASGPLMTRAQLRDCMAQHERVQADTAEVTKQQGDIDREKAEILRQGEVLKEQLAALDRTSQEAVDQYNAQAAARDKRIDDFEARTNAFNQKVEAVQALRTSFAAACENRRYDEADEIAIRKGK